jgi:uroporphyrin-III C-methyltransferase
VVFVTGHAKPGDQGTDWRQLAATARDAKLTLVIYMGVRGAETIQNELLTGLPANTPVAIIENASMPYQRQALTQLDQLTLTLQKSGLQSPSILVVGDVVKACAQIIQIDQNDPTAPTLPLHANM